MSPSRCLLALAVVLVACSLVRGGQVVSLAGPWRFAADRDDVGRQQRWFARSLEGEVRLPGSMQAQGLGDDVTMDAPWTGRIIDRTWFQAARYAPYRRAGNIKVPFWLQPQKVYVGAAWYQREVVVPEAWRGQRVVLTLERCHWTTDVWLDDRHVGSGESLCVPHTFELPAGLAPGAHRLTLRVDNRLKFNVGINAHSVSDHTQSNWNGAVGRIAIHTTPLVWVDDVQVYPDVARRAARIAVRVGNRTGKPVSGSVVLQAQREGHRPPAVTVRFDDAQHGAAVEADYPLGEAAAAWDEFRPNLYELTAALASPAGKHAVATAFGLRSIAAQGRMLAVNGKPILLRGTLECCIFPKTGYPPTDVASWARLIRIAKAHGLNQFRFHSWCPPEAAFAAADRLGFYFQVELPTWVHNLGKDTPRDDFLRRELDRILAAYGNHPCFITLTMGNELRSTPAYLAGLVERAKQADPRRLFSASTHTQRTAADQFRVSAGAKGGRIRGLGKPGTDWDYARGIAPETIPIVSHEIGQHCVWPNLDEMAKYTGVLKARNFEIFRDQLAAHHMADLARPFLLASGKLQALCYKEEIEAARRTPGFAGFQLLQLHDFPGQGTALVGMLDPFWDPKGYITAEEHRRFAGPTAPLARFAKRTWTTDEVLTARVALSHFGPADLAPATATWRAVDHRGQAVASGTLPPTDVPAGSLKTLGAITVPMAKVQAPARLTLTVAVEGTPCTNDWSIWVYPAKLDDPPPKDVLVAAALDETTAQALEAGRRVVLLPPLGRLRGRRENWAPIFWNTQWFPSQRNRSLGLLCDPKHPALAAFPTDFHSDWQWHDLVSRSVAMNLDALPSALRPIVQVVPDWNAPSREALVFEAAVGKGRLLVCSIDLSHSLDQRPAARQLRHGLLRYAAGSDFAPKHTVDVDLLRGLFAQPSRLAGAKVAHCDSQSKGYEARLAIDGDPDSFWHTAWEQASPPFPHELQIDIGHEMTLQGIRYVPRQDGNPNGWIARYEVYVSRDGKAWGEPAARGSLKKGTAEAAIRFRRARRARFFRFVALAGFDRKPWAAIAELDVLPAAKSR